MTHPSDSLDELTADIRHLSTLIGLIPHVAIDIVDADKEQCERTKKEVGEVTDLLWIARDLVEQISENGAACHGKVIAERDGRKAVRL